MHVCTSAIYKKLDCAGSQQELLMFSVAFPPILFVHLNFPSAHLGLSFFLSIEVTNFIYAITPSLLLGHQMVLEMLAIWFIL